MNIFQIFCIFFIFNYCNTTFICNRDDEVSMLDNDLLFFEFPVNYCRINFTLNSNTSLKNKRFNLVLTDVYHYYRSYYNIFHVISNTPVYELEYDDPLHGFALFDEWKDDCPMESISRQKPFMFTDDTQMFTINSHYYSNATLRNDTSGLEELRFLNDSLFLEDNYNSSRNNLITRKNSCLWQFQAPLGYGFKIVVTNLNLQPLNNLNIENSTDLFRTQHNINLFQPYYNSDNYLKISLFGLAKDSSTKEFEAYISIVKNNWTETDGNCVKYSRYWSAPFGHSPNAKCKYELIIPSYEEVIIEPQLNIEPYVDIVQYYSENKTHILNGSCVLPGYTNDSARKILFEFIADGSISGYGFKVEFLYKKCNCSNFNIVVDCQQGSQEFFIGNNSLVKYEYGSYGPIYKYKYKHYYCGNYACNYTITIGKECEEKLIFMHLEIQGQAEDNHSDIFRMNVNKSVVFEAKSMPNETSNASFLLKIDSHRYCPDIDSYPYKKALLYPAAEYFFNIPKTFRFYYNLANYDALITAEKFNISENYEVFVKLDTENKSLNLGESVHIQKETNFSIVFSNTAPTTNNTWIPDVLLYIETISETYPVTTTSETKPNLLPPNKGFTNGLTFCFMSITFFPLFIIEQ